MTFRESDAGLKRAPALIVIYGLLLIQFVNAIASDPSSASFKDWPVVQTDCGPVAGVLADGNPNVYGFYGIPYAIPPLGSLRWKAPVSVADGGGCWSGVLNASAYGSPCLQPKIDSSSLLHSRARTHTENQEKAAQSSPHSRHLFTDDSFSISSSASEPHSGRTEYPSWGSEDCLTVNVFTPPPARMRSLGGSLPVLVSIHGGSSMVGWAGWNNHSALIQEHPDLIVVSLNYRLGALGFLALEALSKQSETGVSGNYGLMDVIEALRWIQNNIASFGGDPTKVTIYGQSSGGTIVLALVVSPLAKGLFQRGLSLSGSAMINQDLKSTELFNLALVDAADCTLADDVAACLYALNATDIVKYSPWDVFPFWNDASVYYSVLNLPTSGIIPGGLEIVDGYVLPLAIEDALAGGAKTANDVDLMLGYMAQEPDWTPPQDLYYIKSEAEYEQWLRNSSLSAWGAATISHVLDLYPYSDYENAQHAFETISADMRTGCGNLRLGKIAAKSFQSKIYFYQNVMRPNQPYQLFPPWTQRYSFHIFDLMNFLDQIHQFSATYPIQPQDETHIQLLQREFLSFILNGHPESDWPALSEGSAPPVAVLGSNITIDSNWKTEQCRYWEAAGFVQLYSWNN